MSTYYKKQHKMNIYLLELPQHMQSPTPPDIPHSLKS